MAPSTDRPSRSKAIVGSRSTSSNALRAFAVGTRILWLFVGAAEHGICGEIEEQNKAEALGQTLTSPLRAELNAVKSAAEMATIKQKQALDQERNRADGLSREAASLPSELDAARMASKESVGAFEVGIKQTQALEQERDKTNKLASELTFVRTELDKTRLTVLKAAEAAATEQEKDRNEARSEKLAGEVPSLRAEFDKARVAATEGTKSTATGVEQQQALEREQSKTDTLARDLTSARAELDTARVAASEAAEATAAEVEQKQALEQQLKQQRDAAEAVARELASLRAELDKARVAASDGGKAGAAEVEQKRALEQQLKQQRDATEAAARELAPSARSSTRRVPPPRRQPGSPTLQRSNRNSYWKKSATRPRRSIASSPRHGSRSRSVRRASLPRTLRYCGSRRQAGKPQPSRNWLLRAHARVPTSLSASLPQSGINSIPQAGSLPPRTHLGPPPRARRSPLACTSRWPIPLRE